MTLGRKDQGADVQGVPPVFGDPCAINQNKFTDALDELIGLNRWYTQA